MQTASTELGLPSRNVSRFRIGTRISSASLRVPLSTEYEGAPPT